MRLREILVLTILTCGVAASTQAAERAWFIASNLLTEVAIQDGGRDWIPIESIALPAHEVASPLVWRGGRHILWVALRNDGQWLVRFDTRSRQFAVRPLDFVPWSLAIDRETTWVVVLGSSTLRLFDVDRMSFLKEVPIPPHQEGESRSLTVAKGVVYVGRMSPDASVNELMEFYAGSLQWVKTVPGFWYTQASRDELRVYAQGPGSSGILTEVWGGDRPGPMATATLDRYAHVVDDALVTEQLAPASSSSVLLRAYDRNYLAFRGEMVAALPHMPRDLLELRQAAPSSPFLLRSQSCSYGVCGRSIQAYEPTTLVKVNELWQAPFDAVGAKLLLLGPPDPVISLHAVENAYRVMLTWNAPPDIGEFEVVVGTAPGRSDVATIPTGGVPRLLIGAFPGTFFVRVRAINDVGVVESAERQIYIP